MERAAADAVATRRALENDETLVSVLLSQLHPAADVSSANRDLAAVRRMCQAPPTFVGEGLQLVADISTSLDTVRSRADLLSTYLPTRSSDIRVQILELRQNRLAPLQSSVQGIAQYWNQTCTGAERQAAEIIASGNQLQQQVGSACANRAPLPSEAELARQK